MSKKYFRFLLKLSLGIIAFIALFPMSHVGAATGLTSDANSVLNAKY